QGIGVYYGDGTAAGSVTGNTFVFATQVTSGRIAVQVNGSASPTISNNTIQDDTTESDIGLDLQVSAASAVQVMTNTIKATGGDIPIRFDPDFFAASSTAQVTGSTYPSGVGSGLALRGAAQANDTLRAIDGRTTYVLDSTLTVAAGGGLAVPAGMMLNGQNNTLNVAGTFTAQQATLQNIYLTYQAGSGGSVTNSTLTNSGGSYITITDASPTFQGNTITQG